MYKSNFLWIRFLHPEVTKALNGLSDDVIDYVCDYILFASPEINGGQCIPNRSIGRRDVIILPHSEEGREFQRTILHEIAHSFKGHRDTSNQMNNELHQKLYDLQEEEARKTVEFWEQEKRVNT